MSSTERAPEPTMEEILASIRRIITDDETGQKTAQSAAPPPPPAAASADDERLEGEADNQIIDNIARVLSGSGQEPASQEDEILDLTGELGGLELVEDDIEEVTEVTELSELQVSVSAESPEPQTEAAGKPEPVAQPVQQAGAPAAEATAPQADAPTASAAGEDAASALERAIAALKAGQSLASTPAPTAPTPAEAVPQPQADVPLHPEATLEPMPPMSASEAVEPLEADEILTEGSLEDALELAPEAELEAIPPLEPVPELEPIPEPDSLPMSIPMPAPEPTLEMQVQSSEPDFGEPEFVDASPDLSFGVQEGEIPAPDLWSDEEPEMVLSDVQISVETEELVLAEPEQVLEPEPVLEPEAALELAPEPAFGLEPEPTLELAPEPAFGFEPEPVLEPDPALELAPRPAFESEPTLELEPTTQSDLGSELANAPFWPTPTPEEPAQEPVLDVAAGISDPFSGQLNGAAEHGEALSSKSLEDSVKEMLRPMLRQWLDENMPRMIQDGFDPEAWRRRQE